MVEWIQNAITNYPRFSDILMFKVFTGLRLAEATEYFNLLLNSEKRNVYLSKDEKTL
jgi:hypothetical protein